MSRLASLFTRLHQEKRAGFVPFITAGDPDFATSLEIACALSRLEVDMIELGMPFSDPMAEGKAIQDSSARALAQGMTMEKLFTFLEQIRKQDQTTPIILMGYANPVFAYGIEAWVQEASRKGADGAIIVDLPPEEDQALRDMAHQHDFSIIRLFAPTSTERFAFLLETAQDFIYYVSITGTTGSRRPDFVKVRNKLEALRVQTTLPIALGFGIKTFEDSKQAAKIADLVVVGSALVEKIASGQDVVAQVEDFAKAHQAAIRQIRKN